MAEYRTSSGTCVSVAPGAPIPFGYTPVTQQEVPSAGGGGQQVSNATILSRASSGGGGTAITTSGVPISYSGDNPPFSFKVTSVIPRSTVTEGSSLIVGGASNLTPAQQEYVKQYEKVITPSTADPLGYYKAVAPVIPGGPALNVETIGLTGWGNIPEAREQVIGGIISQQLTPQQVAALSPGGYVQTPGGRSYYGGSESVWPTPSERKTSSIVNTFGQSISIKPTGEYMIPGLFGSLTPVSSSVALFGALKIRERIETPAEMKLVYELPRYNYNVLFPQAKQQPVTYAPSTQQVLGIGATPFVEKELTNIFEPARKYLPEPVFSFSSGIAKGILELPAGGVDIITGLPQTGPRAAERLLAISTPYGILPQGQKAREEGIESITGGFTQMGGSFIANPFEFAGRFLGASMALELVTTKILKPALETKAEGRINAVVLKTAPEGTDITNLVALEGKYNVETYIGPFRVARKEIIPEAMQQSVELGTPKAYGGIPATVSEAGYISGGKIVKSDLLSGTVGTVGGKEFVDVGALSKLPRMEFPATIGEAGYKPGLIIPEGTVARFSTIGKISGGKVIGSEGLMVQAGEITVPGMQFNRFFSYGEFMQGAKGSVFSDVLVKQLTSSSTGGQIATGTFTLGGLVEISKSMQGVVGQAAMTQQAGILGTIRTGGLALGDVGLQLKPGIAGMLGFTEKVTYATAPLQQTSQTKVSTQVVSLMPITGMQAETTIETKAIPIVSLSQMGKPTQVSLEKIMPVEKIIEAERIKTTPAVSIWEGTAGKEKTIQMDISKSAELEKVIPMSALFQGQAEVQIPMTASLTKTIQTNVFTQIAPTLSMEFHKPFSGGGAVNVFNVPKSKLWGIGKPKYGRGEENPLASILESQQTQSRFMGRSWQLPRSPATLRRWKVAAGMGFGRGFPTRESARGLPKAKFSIFSKSKKKKKRRR